ncbi:hypothetical protein Tco_0535828 [Tanacetum coccineum]
MDDTTNQFDNDVDARLEEPAQTGKEIVQGKGADVEMDEAQQGNENLETTQEQVVDDAHVTITTVTKKTEVPVTNVHVHHEVLRTQAPTLLTIPVSVITESSPVYTNIPQSSQTFTPPPILTTPTPPPTIETTNPLSTLPDFASVFRFNDRITALEKEVAKIKKDPLHTQVTSLVDEHHTRLGETREEFMNFLSESLTTRIKEQVKDQLPQILPKEVSNFCSPRSRKDKDKDEDPFAGLDRGLKKRKLSKDAEPTTDPKKKDSTSGSSKSTKSQPKSSGKSEGPTQNWLITLAASTSTDKSLKDFDELMSTPIDFFGYILNGLKIENLTQEILLGLAFRLLKGTRSNYAELEYDFEECYKALSENLDWENLKGGDYPFDLSKPLPLIKRGKCQRVPFEFFINNDLKGIQSKGDVYSTKRILAVTHVKVMRKHGYGYLEEIVVRRADNKRAEDLQLEVESYQKNIKVTKPDTTRPGLGKRHPYTSYKYPQGFIYVDDYKRNRLMHSVRNCTSSVFGRYRASFIARRHKQKYRHGVLAEEKMEQFEKEKSSFHDQGHQQAAKGKEDDEEFGEIVGWCDFTE